MNFRPAIVIPIYNHQGTIADVVDRLLPYGLTIFIIDDGSDVATQTVLRDIAARQPLVRLFRLEQNSGKGAAVKRGLCEAHRAGYSHGLQIDADGQHDTRDIATFLERSRQHPEALIAGKPIYDDSAPKSRRYGRYITHVWVWIETLSLAIGDSLCGFRLYPLAPSVALVERVPMPSRMTFDTEILVRLFWRGVPVENLPTRVIYPPGGLSHFNLWRDNVHISWMHTRLFFGMLPRLPILLWRKLFSPQFTEAHWSRQAERGTELGLRLTMAAYRYLGDRFARCLLRPVVGWFLLTGGTARRASLNYLERLNVASNGKTPAPTWANSYRHLLAFAESALDKLAAWTGNIAHTSVQFPERPAFDALLATGRGAVLLGAHLGNLEMLRALASRNQIVRINAVVFTEHAQRFAQALAAAHAGFEVNLIQVSAFGPETAIAFREKIERGEMLVIVGDRTPPAQTLEESRRITSANFLGAPALFPQGPFILAALLECPVFLFFCLREADGYCVHFEPFADRIILPRGQRQKALAELTQRYAQQLEALCRRVPYQWFNFFDFWAHPVSAAASPADPPSVNLIAPHPEP